MMMIKKIKIFFVAAGLFLVSNASAQSPWQKLAQKPSTLGLQDGRIEFKTSSFRLQLVKASQTVSALNPLSIPAFDFTPGDSLKIRSSNGMYHLGDINISLQVEGDTAWKNFSTAKERNKVKALPASGDVLAAADLTSTLDASIPLTIKRFWEVHDGNLVLRFELQNKINSVVEIGALGIPMVFNNLLEGKTLEQAHARNVFYDPYTGMDAGYLQVTRLSGAAPSLLVLPYGKTPFEAYNPLLDDPTPRGIVFEGFYEWLVHSKAYAQTTWKNAQQWNEPTSVKIMPGETRSYSLQFVLAGDPKNIETTLKKYHRPVAVGVPGYVLPQNVNGKLFLQYGKNVSFINVEPAGAIDVEPAPSENANWKVYSLHGHTWGRARVTVNYADGAVQTIHYKVIKPEAEVIGDYGNFLTNQQWFEVPNDTFHRSPSVISYDYEKNQQVVQDSRAWIAGLSDEGGAGGWLGATMKQLILPDNTQIKKLERFVDQTLYGNIQYTMGANKFGVRKSLFFYEPDKMPAGTYDSSINFKTWAAWPRKEAENIGRSYNYPHVAAAYWVMYRLARYHHNLVNNHEWDWYLNNAAQTTIAMVEKAPYYAQFGQMEGSVFFFILRDLRREGLTTMAEKIEALMKKRAIHWRSLAYPFGSEMPWDSTGQEEVYVWSYFFGYTDKAEVTLKAILGYMPTLPSWAYNGNARRYWDFLYGGKLSRIERMIHHYGSELNAIPVLQEYRTHPDDLYLLRVGYGGVLGGIANINEEGFAPCAFHSFPSTLVNDGLSGDYGSGFYGYAVNTATYLTKDKELGWLGFGGNVKQENGWIIVEPTTAAKTSAFIAPVGLWLDLKAGTIKQLAFNPVTKQLKLQLDNADEHTAIAYLDISITGRKNKTFTVKGSSKMEKGMYVVPLHNQPTEVVIFVTDK
ncbi:DUF5695 domain-containing protein [Pinibacter aurantiacus]|uniref:DUF4962 domain-containing protein n=1 Tax=Pinibacter aurantiacus TaxID=2851599 RepID=A0A9E2SAC1_9BACT|nr:DUF5695 domain-containing protein [Pinibacter aurantiacus]MBV4357554.1 hypothetical protein [Pinibacter aurantiacus]